jgi:hypothetical protein
MIEFALKNASHTEKKGKNIRESVAHLPTDNATTKM